MFWHLNNCVSQVADEMTRGAEGMLKNVSRNKNVKIEAYKELPGMGRDNCSGIMYVNRNVQFKTDYS